MENNIEDKESISSCDSALKLAAVKDDEDIFADFGNALNMRQKTLCYLNVLQKRQRSVLRLFRIPGNQKIFFIDK